MRRKALRRNCNMKKKIKIRRRIEFMRMVNKKIYESEKCNKDK